MRILRFALGVVLAGGLVQVATAQVLPLEVRQDTPRVNLSSTNGLPISTTRGNPPGSDGRGPTLVQQQAAGLTTAPATTNQFRSFQSLVAATHPGTTNFNPSLPYVANAENLDLPRAKIGNQLVLAMPRATVGGGFLSRSVAVRFGEIIPPPATDEFGVLLGTINTNIIPNRPATTPGEYWLAEPYTTVNHTNAGYYWSPHAQAVFAVNPGSVPVIWRRSRVSTNSTPLPGVTTVQVLGNSYVIQTNQYLVSGRPVKDPRTMYWTERTFADTGKPVTVPSARVGAVNIVYNAAFPERVPTEVVVPGSSPIVTSNTLQELRTLWLEESGPAGAQIRAYNVEGRVFVELLGDIRTGTFRQHLGFEIVDVVRQPTPQDVMVELGDRLTAYPGGVPSDDALYPEPPLFQGSGEGFTFQFSPPGTARPVFYATRETVNQNDLQMHWLEEGLEGLRWPSTFVRYKLSWPTDVAKYSHYVRPRVATEAEAKATAVALPTDNAPILRYQDPLDQPRGKLTETFAYYSWLTPQYPAHRALLQFSSGSDVRFERVFSWLDEGLRDPNLNLPTFGSAFDAEPVGATLLGSAYVGGGFLHLTDALGGRAGAYVLDELDGGAPVENFRARFTVSLRGGGSAPADGFSFSFGDVSAGATLGEEGSASGIAVSFDFWDNGPGDMAPGIAVKLDGVVKGAVLMGEGNPFSDPGALPVPTDPATGQPMRLSTGDTFVPVEIVLNSGGQMDVWFKGVKVLAGVDTGYVPRAGRFGFGARTGGSVSTHWIDDLFIVVNSVSTPAPMLLGGSVATNLVAWVGGTTFRWPEESTRPRIVSRSVEVGQRIEAPSGELGTPGSAGTNYLAGYIVAAQGDLYHPGAYQNPFVAGFDAASRGAILPVNAIPGRERLEVWWFRRSEVDGGRGFKPVLWPSVLGRYTVEWPSAPAEIVLASGDGSGPLTSLQANGAIYFQNDRRLPGFNPNEEHALLQGGQAFALRDDLNITTSTNGEYSSRPFVLVSYTEADGRPAIRPFRVVRERPELGVTFNYAVAAGTVLQPPMPLPLLDKPFGPAVSGQAPRTLNREVADWTVTASSFSPTGQVARAEISTATRHFLSPYRALALQSPTGIVGAITWLWPTNVTPTTVRGWLSPSRPVTLSPWTGAPGTNANRWRYAAADLAGIALGGPGLAFAPASGAAWSVTVGQFDAALGWVDLDFAGGVPLPAREATAFVLTSSTAAPASMAGWRVATEPLSPAINDSKLRAFYAGFTLEDRAGNRWIYRGPHRPTEEPSMVMQFYYRTLPGFYFPTLPLESQPPVGTITPYLRATNSAGGYEGSPVYGNALRPNDGDGQSLGITYRPVWPANVPVLQMAETLLTPKRGLPAVRGETSLEVVYQQSQFGGGETNESVVLHDPTRERTYNLGAAGAADRLAAIPSSVASQAFQGRTFFPNLPPHLVERFYLDPNRGPRGALVFKGVFVDSPVGDTFVHLNVLGAKDAADLKALCLASDPAKAKWDAAIAGLATTMETFGENPARPGTYQPVASEVVDAGRMAQVRGGDVAVDSYGLTATGPGSGYVTLLAGNGRAFTPESDPVSVRVLRVANTLYRGEVNLVESSNPLNEKLTLQQVIDLAGETGDYAFQWKIASPVDGLPPVVYQNSPRSVFSDGLWSHLRFPLDSDSVGSVQGTPAGRLFQDAVASVAPVSRIAFNGVTVESDLLRFDTAGLPHGLSAGNRLTVRQGNGAEFPGTVHASTTADTLMVQVDPSQTAGLRPGDILELNERAEAGRVQSILFRSFTVPAGNFSSFWLSLALDDALGAAVSIDGQEVVRVNTGAGDSLPSTAPAGLLPLSRAFALPPAALAGGASNPDGSRTHVIAVALYSTAYPAQAVAFNARLEAFESVDVTSQQWLPLEAARHLDGIRAVLGGTADVRSLADNYVIMRYQARSPGHASYVADGQGGNAAWSQWTSPQLAEGWIKRVLKGINPFNQRITDLFNNSVNTDVSIVAQAGQRWEGDVALNLDTINSAGLIEIYETVLNRGRAISIGSGINYGPANDALLLAAGYLNDLYMVLGNEAWADAANPTIGIGTKDNTYGEIATALFAFRGQLPSLLEEELALLRGRDDFLLPGVELRPVYNRMVWNYTRGIDAGEVVYALNYNVLDQNGDGRVDADDARRLHPQGHGDAYGHYLTALKGYYSLLGDPSFDWVPRSEAVTVLGRPVSVDYQDERKFAAAAGALARAGRQVFDLTWRRDYKSGQGNGWSHFAGSRANTTTRSVPTTRYWGLDHWAARTGQGAYLNWVIGNAILPDRDPDPAHAGSIQQIDRTTVPELAELAVLADGLQTGLDNAEAGLTPLGLPDAALPFDLNPLSIANGPNTHFEQMYQRAKEALNNAVASFDDAKDVTRLMRSEADSLADFRAELNQQELAYTNALIEIYGTPYTDDIGAGRTYRAGYAGPDLIHYMYVENPEISTSLLNPKEPYTIRIDTQTFTANWVSEGVSDFSFITKARTNGVDGPLAPGYATNGTLGVEFTLDSHGFFQKPKTWSGRRGSPGRLQQSISDIVKARNAAYQALYGIDAAKADLDWALRQFELKKNSHAKIRGYQSSLNDAEQVLSTARLAYDVSSAFIDRFDKDVTDVTDAVVDAIPDLLIAGLAFGGDVAAPISSVIKSTKASLKSVLRWGGLATYSVQRSLEYATETANRFVEFNSIAPEEFSQELRDATSELRDKVYGVQNLLPELNARLQELEDARAAYQALMAEGERIQAERQIFRQRAAAIVQGYRSRDAAFRIFRNEKLERYKALFDLAAQYAFIAAQAYDYDTGLLHTSQGREFINRIVRSRALGVVLDGEPQFAGSNTGDPGLSSALAEMKADWQVLRGRLGFNNPDAYGTTTSLRTENFRILPGTNGADQWKAVLHEARRANLLDDPDVRRYCMQIDRGDGLPVPGLVIEFSTVIADGLNLYGRPLAAYDHAFSPAAFATKVFALGVALEGYAGMEDPATNDGAVDGGGASPAEPDLSFLDPDAMAANPYIYVIPVGVDSMRSPPLGDRSVVRTWNVQDVTVPLPFNIGGSDFSTRKLWQSYDSLTEPMFGERKHQPFRPVSSSAIFGDAVVYWTGGELERVAWTNTRLLGRSVWNSKWKIVIPGRTLLNNPDEGIERFIRTVHDIRLFWHTYSYSGN